MNTIKLISAARFHWLRNTLHLKILWRLMSSNCVLFSQGYGVDDGGMVGRLDTPWCTRCRVRVDRGSEEFFWSISSLGSVVG